MARTVVTLTHNRFPEIARRLPVAAARVVAETVAAIETEIKTEMAAPKSGVWYGDHQASAPGEAPAIDTGMLVNSIQTEVKGTEGVVFTNMEYAPYLEFGAPMASIEPRPFFMPAAEAARPGFVRKLQDLESQL